MSDAQTLIPPPPVVREKLARHIREGRLLRALYRLSLRAAEERHSQNAGHEGPEPSERPGGGA
jgi:hypothetical protein